MTERRQVVARRYTKWLFLFLACLACLRAISDRGRSKYLWAAPVAFFVAYVGMARRGRIVANDEGILEDGQEVVKWTDVRSVQEVSRSRVIFELENGETKKLSLFDVRSRDAEAIKEMIDRSVDRTDTTEALDTDGG